MGRRDELSGEGRLDARDRWHGGTDHSEDARPLRWLWLVDVPHEAGLRHGGTLRFVNFARELVGQGHQVYFLVNGGTADPAARRRFLDELKADGTCTDYLELAPLPDTRRGRFAYKLTHPAIVNRILRRIQEPAKTEVRAVAERYQIDVCVVNDRRLLFATAALREQAVVAVDWTDSHVLFWGRQLATHLRHGALKKVPMTLRYLAEAFCRERYYGRRSDINLVVSPVDKKYLDVVDGVPRRNQVLYNGVRAPGGTAATAKERHRLIFSGNMDFPPNYEAAIWFIDRVLPLLLERDPEVVFVVAGANPTAGLLARAGDSVRVTGQVDDMMSEISRSALYVAPLISGGGFKNKIVEALSCGTYVVGTRKAVEFLEERFRARMLIADSPRAMADRILDYLAAPERYEADLEVLRRAMRTEFTWAGRTQELLAIVHRSLAERGVANRGMG
jgi:glycosyltransferase involved in cell wall biosynthesis